RRPPGRAADSARLGRAAVATARMRRGGLPRVRQGHLAAAPGSTPCDVTAGEKQLVAPSFASSLFGADVYQSITWHSIVRTLPFPLYLHAALRRRMPEARIGSRQRVLALFVQHLQVHGGLFVGWRMRHRVNVAA